MITTLLQGLLFGIAYVAPIGTQNLFVINAALQKNKIQAIQATVCTIFFDITLAITCFFGIGLLIGRNPYFKYVIMVLGSIIIFYIAITILRSNILFDRDPNFQKSFGKIILTSFSVTWLNPQAIIDGSLILGSFRSVLTNNMSLIFIIGVCCASILWFVSLTVLAYKFIGKFEKVAKYINIGCGIILIIYGVKLLYIFFIEVIL